MHLPPPYDVGLMARYRLVLDPGAGDPEIGRWLAALDEVRRDTLKVLADLPDDAADRDPGDGGDTIGTILYHVALIEADWVFSDVLDRESEIRRDLFPADDRTKDGHLTQIRGESLAQHLDATRPNALDGARRSSGRCRPTTSTASAPATTTTCRPTGSSST